MRPIWTGGISFGLIYIPVNLYSATNYVQLDLDMLSKKTLAPIKYARIDSKTGKEVSWKDIIKGFEYKKGDYVILENSDFEKLNLHKSKTIEIEAFVDANKIDDIYFEKPYYLEPSKGAEKTYGLLVEALKKSKKVGVSEFILRNREHLCVLKPENNMLILNQMRYKSEIKSPENLNIPKSSTIKPKEIELALTLINSLSEDFNPNDYKDDYIEGMKKLIEAKKHNKKISAPKSQPKQTKTEDLMQQLKKSLEQVKA